MMRWRGHIVCNKNAVPNDPQKPSVTSGLRVGTPAGTTRGFGETEFAEIANMIADVIEACERGGEETERVVAQVREKATALCRAFPIYEGGLS